MNEEEKKICFVIMPFSDTKSHNKSYWDDHYKYLKSLLDIHPLDTHRSEALRGDIVRQIINDLVTSHIVVADLTDLNANVFWELGVRQSFKHCNITIFEENEIKLPFDLAAKGTLYYQPRNHIKMHEFENKFHTAINDCLSNPKFPDSFVLESITGRGTLYQIITKEETLRKLNAMLAEINYNSGFLKSIKITCTDHDEGRKKDKSYQGHIPTLRFRVMSAESLWVNRYIDADSSFYDSIDNYMTKALAYNEQLSCWSDDTSTEKWLIEKYDLIDFSINEMQRLVTNQRDKILSST